MTIQKIETKVEYIPLKTPFVTALRRVETIEFVRVFVRCSDTKLGIGEAPATLAITGEDIEKILDSIALMSDSFIGLSPKEALLVLHKFVIGSSAKAALDMAFISLLAQEEEKTLAKYHNIVDFRPIKTDITISLGTTPKMLHDTKIAFENSMDILKIKLGPDIFHAIEITQLLYKQFPQATLLIDANQAWSKEETFLYLEAIDASKITLIEQPVIASNLEALKEITDKTSISILADEAAFTLEDVKRVVESKSANMINIKLMKCGGVSKAMEILEYAREQGVKCMLGSMLEGPYSINAALYLAFAYRDVIAFVDLDSPLLYAQSPEALDFCFDGATITLRDF